MLVTEGWDLFIYFFLRGLRRSGRQDNKVPDLLIIVLLMPPRMFSVNSIFETEY